MIKGLLIYNESDAQLNKWFIEHLIEVSKSNGIELSFCIFNQELFAHNTGYFNQFDFCINRTRNSSVNVFFDTHNIRCFNNLKTVSVSNDKWLTYLLCKEIGIPTIETVQLNDTSNIELDYPFIIKSKNGHGGSEVFWINGSMDLNKLELNNENGYIAQKPVSDIGIDVRIYVLGNRPITGVKRTSLIDFRSNFSLGGQVELFSPTDEQLAIIKALQEVLSADYAGFDFILHKGQWILNEIEDAVGARMLYSLLNYDIGEEFIRYIRNNI